MNLRNARFADDPRPIDEASTAAAGARLLARLSCAISSKSGEILGMMALTAINLAYYQDLMAGARDAIARRAARAIIVAETRKAGRAARAEAPRSERL